MKPAAAILALAVLAACDAQTGGSGPATANNVPAVLAQNLNAASFTPGAQTISIQLDSLDASPFSATYTRNPALDVRGYQAYDVQEASQQRHFVALFRGTGRGNATAGVVADGGQFVNYFGGGTFARIDTFTRPASGLAVYNGSYAGLLNTGTSTGPLDPAQPFRTQGTIRITADFLPGGSLTGGITNRTVVDSGATLQDVFMDATTIDDTGAFQGTMMFGDKTPIGDYGGLFAGLNASDVAGVLVINPVRGNSDLFEHGVFVLPCTNTNSGVPCP